MLFNFDHHRRSLRRVLAPDCNLSHARWRAGRPEGAGAGLAAGVLVLAGLGCAGFRAGFGLMDHVMDHKQKTPRNNAEPRILKTHINTQEPT
ncbi:hypothetical protein VWT76_16025 [Xanthomonas citri pv. citri]|nr:hypothetical protein [Xanthomonas citri pv. citri]MBD5054715.1 hypothetical protein [Xanthomonas citri pv. citri]